MRIKQLIAIAAIAALAFSAVLVSCMSGGGVGNVLLEGESPEIDDVELYDLEVKLSCVKNLIFSRYDVDVYIDDKKIGTVDHGTDKDIDVKVSEGKHVFRVEERGNPSTDGSHDFEMSAEESTLECSLKCTSDQVEINDFSIRTIGQIAEDEARAKEEEERAVAEKAAQEEREAKEKAEAEAAAAAEKERKEAERAEAEAERAAKEAEEAAGPVSELTAELYTKEYGETAFPYGFKLHYLVGVLNAERQDDGSMFLKIYCDVKNQYGVWAKDLVCESVVGGTEGDPQMISFNVY